MSLSATFTRRALATAPRVLRPTVAIRTAHFAPAPRPQVKMAAVASSIAKTAHSALSTLASKAEVKVGDAVPSVAIRTEDMSTTIDFSTLKGKNIIVTVPGAFTPTCHSQIPGFIADADKFKTKGVEGIYVVSVNDLFVVNAWKKDLAADKIKFAADDKAELAAALGIVLDATGALGGPRLKRAVIVVQDGKVTNLEIEPDSGKSTVTQAENVLAKL